MAADGTGVVGGGAVGGGPSKDGLHDAKSPEPIPNRRRASSLSRDAQRRAYQWCREYLGGAWRRARPEELSVCPVRSGVSLGGPSGHPSSVAVSATRGAGLQTAVLGAGWGVWVSLEGHGKSSREGCLGWVPPIGGRLLLSLTCVDLQRRTQQSALPMLATEPPAQCGRGAPGGAATCVRGHPAGCRLVGIRKRDVRHSRREVSRAPALRSVS